MCPIVLYYGLCIVKVYSTVKGIINQDPSHCSYVLHLFINYKSKMV